ncbi:dTDP-4-dehydrorhamnose reductase [Ralstonia pickettii]|uniref:dTDP-4-dehydrorhamnose reductase n=1 Tax=Ralstonia pickettii TaxID=329 RepID=UPI0015BA8345|nr:dTDP-4-dehydrorhamnose reductase [Ralstonia pickettii]NWK43826.1 dTDP-4-dehydrorhamnose reductase [Ralstonia pickettii]
MAEQPRILLLGTRGQVGFELRRSLAPIGMVHATDRTICDLANADNIRKVLDDVRPDVIVNAAAYTAVDKAETEHDQAFLINARAPGILAEAASTSGALLVHYSTDYVFSGTKDAPYSEGDSTDPLSYYGQSKLLGERAILETAARAQIFRTSWVLGSYGTNFAKTILRLAREKTELRVINDQLGAPTSAALIADVTAHTILAALRKPEDGFCGLFHLTGKGETTWHEYAQFVVQRALDFGADLKLRPEAIIGIPSAEYPLPAKRPANSRMSTDLLCSTFGVHLPHWKDGVEHVIAQLTQ